MRKMEEKEKKNCHSFTFINILNSIACLSPNTGKIQREFKQPRSFFFFIEAFFLG